MHEIGTESKTVPVRVRYSRGEQRFSGRGTMQLDELELLIIVDHRRLRAAYDRLDGITFDPPLLVLHPTSGGVLEAEGTVGLESLAEEIARRACAFPEVTRALRTFGGARLPADGLVYDTFFAPLIRARRSAEAVQTMEARLAPFAAAGVRSAIETAASRLAVASHRGSAPHQRALEAMLLDAAEPLFAALSRLDAADAEARSAPPERRFAAWRAWSASVRAAFEAADRAWAAASRELSATLPVSVHGAGWLEGSVIVGVGIDVVDIGRVERLLDEKGERAFRRLFTDAERAYASARLRRVQHLAARIAAKEAAFKAFSGTSEARSIGWREIEVVTRDDGRPALVFHGRAAARAAELGVERAWISLSHGDHTAHAVVVLEGD